MKLEGIKPPWYVADRDLSIQLKREMKEGHILYGLHVKTIARRQDNDDVLFEVEGAPFNYAWVHLTWAQQTLPSSDIPHTTTYVDWQDVYQNKILPDILSWH